MWSSKLKSFISIAILIILISCSGNLHKRLTLGNIKNNDFLEKISFETKKGLAIVPVRIRGNLHYFLFDTGAPTSISKKLQTKYNFKVIDKGNINDSEGFTTRIEYVSIDSLKLGSVIFDDQTAFVGDYEKNPILGCLGIEGIIGSNTQRFCNWTINFDEETIQLFSTQVKEEGIPIKFTTDFQYDINFDLELENATVNNMKLDYGSNGNLTLIKKDYEALEQLGIIDTSLIRIGYSQSGITGKISDKTSKSSRLKSVSPVHNAFDSIFVKEGNSKLLGTGVLSKAIVTIDWQNQNIWFKDLPNHKPSKRTFGLNLGYTDEKGIYILSVIKGSKPYNSGLRPGLQALTLGEIDFFDLASYCEYVQSDFSKTDSIKLRYINSKSDTVENQLVRLKYP